MLSPGRREPRWAAGAICLALAGGASAQGSGDGVLLAAIAPIPVETITPIPEPGQYVFHYEMQYSSYREAAAALRPADFYAAPVGSVAPGASAMSVTPVASADALRLQPQAQPQVPVRAFGAMASSVSLVDMFQLMDDGKGTAAHPPRRLAMMIDDWRVSASAHFPFARQHDSGTGATVSVQHKF